MGTIPIIQCNTCSEFILDDDVHICTKCLAEMLKHRTGGLQEYIKPKGGIYTKQVLTLECDGCGSKKTREILIRDVIHSIVTSPHKRFQVGDNYGVCLMCWVEPTKITNIKWE